LGELPCLFILLNVQLNEHVDFSAFLGISFLLLLMFHLSKVVKLLSVFVLSILSNLNLIIEVLLGELIVVLDQGAPLIAEFIIAILRGEKRGCVRGEITISGT
jgi:hypothetical protein